MRADLVVHARPQVLFCEIDGEAVVLEPGSGRYFGLNEIATRAWTLLQSDGRLDTVVEHLLHEYDVSADRLRGDLEAWIGELLRHGLVEISTS